MIAYNILSLLLVKNCNRMYSEHFVIENNNRPITQMYIKSPYKYFTHQNLIWYVIHSYIFIS